MSNRREPITSKSFSQYYDYWMGTALKIARNRDEASDLLHEVLSQVLTNPKCQALCESGDIKQYVSVAICKNYYSSKGPFHEKFRSFNQLRSDLNEKNLHNKSDDTWLGARVVNEQLDIVISRLPDFERDIFLLYIMNDFDYSTLSKETDIPVKVIRRIINYSKSKIKDYVVRKK